MPVVYHQRAGNNPPISINHDLYWRSSAAWAHIWTICKCTCRDYTRCTCAARGKINFGAAAPVIHIFCWSRVFRRLRSDVEIWSAVSNWSTAKSAAQRLCGTLWAVSVWPGEYLIILLIACVLIAGWLQVGLVEKMRVAFSRWIHTKVLASGTSVEVKYFRWKAVTHATFGNGDFTHAYVNVSLSTF